MVEARRAAAPDEAVAELGPEAARRAADTATGASRVARLVMAPIAILSVVGLAAGLMVVPANERLQVAEPASAAAASIPLDVSRNSARSPITPSASPTPSATTPSVTPTPSSTPTATASPSVAPSPSAAPSPAVTPSPAVKPSPTAVPSAPSSAAPAPAPAPAPSTPAKPKVDYTALGKEAGTRYATAPVNVRVGPGTGHDVRTSVAEGKAFTITDREIDGWRQVIVSKKSGWVKGSYLTETAPPKPTPKPTPTPAPKPAAKAAATTNKSAETTEKAESTGFSTASCAKASGIESGLTSRTKGVLRAVCAEFPRVSSYGGRRAGGGSFHGSGRAIDVMVSGEYGWQIAKWARANAGSLGITEVIYEQKIWTSQRSGDGWRSMSDRGSASANHYDHVHISVR